MPFSLVIPLKWHFSAWYSTFFLVYFFRLAAWAPVFLYHPVSLQITQTGLLPGFSLYLPLSGQCTSLYKHSISFDVCLNAVVCLNGFSKLCWHFLIACYVWFVFFSWVIILGEASTSSISLNTVWILWVCFLKQEGGLWGERTTDMFCQVPGEFHDKQRSRLRQAGCSCHLRANRTKQVG